MVIPGCIFKEPLFVKTAIPLANVSDVKPPIAQTPRQTTTSAWPNFPSNPIHLIQSTKTPAISRGYLFRMNTLKIKPLE
jgi:hypothetical protein